MFKNMKGIFVRSKGESHASLALYRALLRGVTILGLWLMVPVIPPAFAQDPVVDLGTELPPEYANNLPQDIKDEIKQAVPVLGGKAMFVTAKAFGPLVTKIEGKSLEGKEDPNSEEKPERNGNVGIATDPTKAQNEPTVATNPANEDNLVVASHFGPFKNRIAAFNSFDRGATWSGPILLPLLNSSVSVSSDPVLAFAPDGSRVYAAYMDLKTTFRQIGFFIREFTIKHDIVVSFSDDGGKTWTGPIVALESRPATLAFFGFFFRSATPGFFFDKPWISTHKEASQSNTVYATATRFDLFGPANQPNDHIAFARSVAKGVAGSWSTPVLLDSSRCPVRVVQGSRPAAGPGGEVLVAWYDSADDGWLIGKFKIRTRRSPDNGATFNATVDAVIDKFEALFFLGPFNRFHRWWPVMFPSVEIDRRGRAHVAYAHAPDPPISGFFGLEALSEAGDIRYITSPGPPFATWSAPIKVNDDGTKSAQGFAALRVDEDGTVHLIWEDHREARRKASTNMTYGIFHAQKEPGRATFSRNTRVSDGDSVSSRLFLGDYIDLAINSDYEVFGVWTDRRHLFTEGQNQDNVFGGRIDN